MSAHALTRGLLVTGVAVALAAPTAWAVDPATASPTVAGSRDQTGATVPPGWSVDEQPGLTVLTWQSSTPIPLSDAPVEFRLGKVVLGTPKPAADGKTFTLELSAPLPGPGRGLRVTQGGLPLDSAGEKVVPPPADDATRTARSARDVTSRESGIDPGLPGRYQTTTKEYSLPGIGLTGLPKDVEVQGVVVRPTGTHGPRPLVLFLHGRHSTCYQGGPDGASSGQWPCRNGWDPIPSYRGYLDAQELLASQGYVTVSISANGINGQDYQSADGGALARSELVRYHLSLFRRWSSTGGAPFGTALVGAVELDDVMLVGHSRGGEGVNRAAVDSTAADPWQIDSQVLIGPTSFGRQTAPGVDTAVLLPFCDGDVSDLQGQQYIDQARDLAPSDPALRSAVMVFGANHNYFNSEWTPGVALAPAWDDWGGRSGECGSQSATRLTAEDQRNVGAVYIATAARAFVKDNTKALSLLDGSPRHPASLGDAQTLVTALGANRTHLVTFDRNTDLRSVNASAFLCHGYRTSRGQVACAPNLRSWVQPHFLPMYNAENAPAPRALRMRWRQPGAHVKVQLPQPVDLSESSSIDLRVAVRRNSPRARLGIVVGDTRGNVARLGSETLHPLPGDRFLSKFWAQAVRVALPEERSFDESRVAWVRFVGESRDGSVVILDGFGRDPGPSVDPRPALPRIDADSTTVKEGDGGEHFANLTLDVSGRVTGGERFYVESTDNTRGTRDLSTVIRLRPGQSSVEVAIPVTGDTRDDYVARVYVTVKAISGVITGDYQGQLTIRDDDPPPTVTIPRPSQTTVEGGVLRWNLRLDGASDKWVRLAVKPTAAGDTELAVGDLTSRFRRQYNLRSVPADLKLSDSRLRMFASIRPGRLKAHFELPIRSDSLAEGDEQVTLKPIKRSDLPLPSQLFGTVTDPVT